MHRHKQAVTIAELIIVISLLAILWIVAILSIWSYLTSVRDSSRIVELENIETTLASYILKSWFYPTPDESVNVTYLWGTIWTQWVFWNGISDIIWYSQDIVDPSTKKQYTYSIKNTKREFALAWVLEESPWLVSSNWFIEDTYAETNWTKVWTALVKWNYNWELLSVITGWSSYVLAIPSIISSDLVSTDIVDILNNNKLVYNDFNNLPASYTWSIYDIYANHDFSANNLVVFTWSISKLRQSYNQVALLQNLYTAYSWSILWKNLSVNKIDPLELFSPEPSTKIASLACDLVNFKLKYFVECGWVDFLTFFVVNVLHIDISNLPSEKITVVYQDSNWDFIFWTDKWVAFYDWTDWVIYDKHTSPLVHDKISSISQDDAWDYWIGTVNWISRLDLWGSLISTADDIWTTYWHNDLVGTHIQYIYTADDGTVWIWTNVWVTSYSSDIWTDYTKQSDWLTHSDISSIYTDSIWNVWFWSHSKWVDKYRISDGLVTNYDNWALPNSAVSYIYEDLSNRVRVWTTQWIWRSTDYWNTWEIFTTESTFGWLPDDTITYIFEDSVWNVWVWTDQWWVVKYDDTTWTTYDTGNWLLWINIFLVLEDENWNIIIVSNWWLDTIDSSWNIITV